MTALPEAVCYVPFVRGAWQMWGKTNNDIMRAVPEYGTVMKKGVLYYRTRIKDANGKFIALYPFAFFCKNFG